MEIYDLKVNHLKNPLGFHMNRAVFSWKVKSAKGKKQMAARICVAANPELLKSDKNLIKDTGFCRDADSQCFLVLMNLKPYKRYFWNVTVQTDADEEETSDVQWFETAKMDEQWTGRWITCDSKENRHPYFEKDISVRKEVKNARLYICGLGLYEAYINNTRVGNEYLTPYSNDYNEWLQYQTYDITDQICGRCRLSVLLGNGWYKSRFGFDAHKDVGFYGHEWKLIAEIRIVYSDGTVEVIGTDDRWEVRRSSIVFSNLYDGEQRDDTLGEMTAERARYCDPPKGRLTERMSLPVTVHEEIAPIELLITPAGEQVFDMGQNFAGIFRLHVNEPKGTRIHIQTGEVLQKGCFYNENLRTAKSEYVYVSDGVEKDIIPHFTYYGYRYVKVEGITALRKEDFTGLALYSGIEQKGSISTGNGLVNKLISNVRWGMKSNFIDVPTDCPQRDERMGWTGDTQVFSPTATYLADTYAFYTKYLYDMAQEQKTLNGKVPDVIPSCGVTSTACVWGDAACIIPWNLYQFYGDKSILEDQFESMRSWVDYVRRVDGDNHGWRHVFHYGDWLALDNPAGGVDQVLGGTDEEFIANIYYAASAGIVAEAAKVLGKENESEEYEALSKEQFKAVKEEYYSKTGRCCINTQTALLLTLKYHLSDNEELVKKQLRKLFSDNDDKLKTGFVGTPLMCNILSDNGFGDLAYRLLLNEEYPGWLHEVKLGATTVWERWNSLDENGNISSTGMNSLNHYSYGAVVEWIFRHCAGINAIENGFSRVVLRPEFNWEIRSIDAVYDSPSGEYQSSWEIKDENHVHCKYKIPFGCQAELILPYLSDDELEAVSKEMGISAEMGALILNPGSYEFTYGLSMSIKPKYSVVSTTVREFLHVKGVKEALSEIVDLESMPKQYLDYSLVEISEKFGGRLSKEQLGEIDEVLSAYYTANK